MRKFTVISAFSVLMALSLAGCTPGGNNIRPNEPNPVLVSINAETGSGNTFTEYLYDEYGAHIGIKQSLAGSLVFEEGEYTYDTSDNSRTCIRTYTDPDKPAERRISTFAFFYDGPYNMIMVDKDGKVFPLDENGNPTSDVPAEEWTREFDNSGNLTRYEHKVNGVRTILQANFRYDIPNKHMTFDLTEGDAPAVEIYHQYTDDGYEMYKGYVSSSNKGTLVETMTDSTISSDGLVKTYTMTVYDADGVATRTYYTFTSEIRTFKIR